MSTTQRKRKPRQHKSERTRLIAKIHAQKRQLGWSDDRYRACLIGLTGRTSCSDITSDGALLRVSNQMAEELGETPSPQQTRSHQATGQADRISDKQVRYIMALWRTCVKLGLFNNIDGIDSFVYRQTGVTALTWLPKRQVNQVVTPLRRKIRQAENVGGDNA